MASARLAFLASSMVLLSSVAMATDHNVGDDQGWTVDYNYTQWAKDKVFRVGDNLVFNFDNQKHNVFRVNGSLFNNCTFPDANQALTSGKDVIPLATPGRKWYICGKANHCASRGMKLAITVVSDGPSPSPAPAPSSSHSPLASAPGLLMAPMLAVAALIFA